MPDDLMVVAHCRLDEPEPDTAAMYEGKCVLRYDGVPIGRVIRAWEENGNIVGEVAFFTRPPGGIQLE